MRNFIFHNPVKIYFGEGQAVHVTEEAKSRPGAVLLVYGGGSIKRNGAYDDVTAALREAGNEVVELSGVTPNPRLDKVLEGVNLVREHGVSLILAVGGGSVIDCAKFISLGSGLGEDEDLWDDYVETGKPAPENLVPLVVVLTIAATGSEMGDAAVLTNWARNRKLGYTSFPLTPKFSVLDPTYLLTLPAEQTTYGFVDMFCHTCEQYFSLPSDDNLSDEMAEAIQRHILRSWCACRRHPRSYEARGNAMWDSTFALNRVISRGKEEDWGTHGIEHALSAYFDIPHGAGLAVVHPHWMKYVYTSRPEATARFARWAVNVWGVDSTGKSEREVAEEGIERYADFSASGRCPAHPVRGRHSSRSGHAGQARRPCRRRRRLLPPHHPRRCACHPRLVRDTGRVLRMYQGVSRDGGAGDLISTPAVYTSMTTHFALHLYIDTQPPRCTGMASRTWMCDERRHLRFGGGAGLPRHRAVVGHMIRQRPYYPALGGVRKSLKRWIALPYHAAAESDSA